MTSSRFWYLCINFKNLQKSYVYFRLKHIRKVDKLLLANNEVHLEKYVQLLRLAPLFITPTTNAFGCHFQLLPIINKFVYLVVKFCTFPILWLTKNANKLLFKVVNCLELNVVIFYPNFYFFLKTFQAYVLAFSIDIFEPVFLSTNIVNSWIMQKKVIMVKILITGSDNGFDFLIVTTVLKIEIRCWIRWITCSRTYFSK